MITANTKKLISAFGEDAVAEMVGILKSKGKEARGRLVSSLHTNLQEGLEELVLEFSMEDYGKYVDKGRRPGGKQPPLSNIREWCEIKGIDTRAAFPIARKIARDGIPAVDFFEVPLMMRLELLKQPLEEAMKQDLRAMVRTVAKKINNE